MLKEILAVDILNPNIEGGTTKPILVLGEDGEQYILKIFKQIHANQRCYTGAEVCAHTLAKEFALNTPEAALIQIPIELISFINETNPSVSELLKSKDLSKPCFGSQYMEGCPTHSPSLLQKFLDLDELETIFAFDTLILNEDRKNLKPNILKQEENYLLIDHDKAFEGYNIAPELFTSNNLMAYSSNHIFFGMLKKEEQQNKNSVRFETFEEYLRTANFRLLEKEVDRLTDKGYNTFECYKWITYLKTMKGNYAKFVGSLRFKIRN